MFNSIFLSVSADSAFYEKWADILENKGLFRDGLRTFLWGLAKVFAWICDACEKLLVMANKAIGFIYSEKVVEFISQWRFVIIGILIIAVLLFGINMIVNKKQDRSKLLQNFAIAACVLIGLSTFIPTLGKNAASWSSDLIGSNSSSSATIIKGAVTDLYYLDANNFSDSAAKTKNNISSGRIMNIDPTEEITSSDDVSNPKVFSYRLSYDKNGKPVLNEIDDSGFSWNNDPYYRYDIDFTTIYITLFATAIVMIFTAFKVVKIVFDIIVHQILAVVLAAGDWASGQKLKEVIKSLFALFFSVFMCSVMMKLYFLFSSWTSSNIESGLARALILVFAAFAVIDGPNIVEKIFGIDAGLASTFRSVSTLFFASSGAARLAKGAAHGVGLLTKGAVYGAGGTGGFFYGLSKSIKNAQNGMSGNKQGVADSAANKKVDSSFSDDKLNNSKNSNADLSNNSTSSNNATKSYNQNKEDNLNLNGNNDISEKQNSSADLANENNESGKSIANAAAENGYSEDESGFADHMPQRNADNNPLDNAKTDGISSDDKANVADSVTQSDKHNNAVSNAEPENKSSINKSNVSDSASKSSTSPNSIGKDIPKNSNLNNDKNQKSVHTPIDASSKEGSVNTSKQNNPSLNNSNNDGVDKTSVANVSSEQSKSFNNANISDSGNRKENSVSNSADKENKKSGFDYLDNKSKNPHSVIGAGVRGRRNGQYFGEKIGNAATKIARKRNLKGDEK